MTFQIRTWRHRYSCRYDGSVAFLRLHDILSYERQWNITIVYWSPISWLHSKLVPNIPPKSIYFRGIFQRWISYKQSMKSMHRVQRKMGSFAESNTWSCAGRTNQNLQSHVFWFDLFLCQLWADIKYYAICVYVHNKEPL